MHFKLKWSRKCSLILSKERLKCKPNVVRLGIPRKNSWRYLLKYLGHFIYKNSNLPNFNWNWNINWNFERCKCGFKVVITYLRFFWITNHFCSDFDSDIRYTESELAYYLWREEADKERLKIKKIKMKNITKN